MKLKSAKKSRHSRLETSAGQTKVLLYDVESSPNQGFTWGKWEQDVIEFVKQKQIICFSWKWLHEDKVHVLALPDFARYKRDPENNRDLICALHKLFNEADIIVGHNIDNFDDKMSNTDFIKHNLPPPHPHKTIDTLKVARKYFKFNSNKLGDLGEFLKLGRKVKHEGFGLWLKCMAGDRKAWSRMRKYNAGDVILLQKIYLRFRPWLKIHPDMNAKDNHVGCRACKGTNMQSRGIVVNKGAVKKRRYVCTDCGSWHTVTLGRKQLSYNQGN